MLHRQRCDETKRPLSESLVSCLTCSSFLREMLLDALVYKLLNGEIEIDTDKYRLLLLLLRPILDGEQF